MIISNVSEVRKLYADALQKGWVLPCICTENLTTTEAILSATHEFGIEKGIKHVPIIIAITCNYDHRAQAQNYTHTRDYKTGLKLFVNDVKALADDGCIFEDVNVMLHLDHIQFDNDAQLLESDLSEYSSIMFDASTLAFDENIRLTKEFVAQNKSKILIEGACDEIVDATGTEHNDLTTPKNAQKFARETGVDLIVANLGTEHRATGKELKYHGDVARAIKAEIGTRIVLHGTSSVSNNQVYNLFEDGICKVNIWTALERDSSPILFENMTRNASKVAGPQVVQRLIDEGYLTEKCLTGDNPSIANFTTVSRQEIVFQEMKRMVKAYLNMWYK